MYLNVSLLEKFLNDNIPIDSISVFLISYQENTPDLVKYIRENFKDIEISLGFNSNKSLKSFIYSKNTFKTLELLKDANISLYDTTYSTPYIIIDKKIIYHYTEQEKFIKTADKSYIDYLLLNNFNLSLEQLAKKYINYVCSKDSLFDTEMEYFILNSNIIVNEKNIPQFSNFENAHTKATECLVYSGFQEMSFLQLGKLLNKNAKTDAARKKYGENQGKFSELVDFIYITRKRTCMLKPTALGRLYIQQPNEIKLKILTFQIYKLDIIQYFILNSYNANFNLEEYLKGILSEKTVIRRLPNVNKLLRYLNLI